MRGVGARHWIAPSCILAGFIASGCGENGGARGAVQTVRTDSAGVQIVLNSIVGAAVPVFATPDSAPDLRLGSLDGDPQQQFGSVSDVVALPDGSVAVLDGQAALVRLFGENGEYRGSLGSKGQGPGEFDSPLELGLLPGDTLAVYDPGPRRITRFGPDGELGRITTLSDTRARIVAASFLPDGGMVGQSRWLAPGGGSLPGPELTFGRDSAVLTAFTTEGMVADTVDVLPGRETVTGISRSEGSISVYRRSAAFGRTNVFAVHPDGIWSSPNDRFELSLYAFLTGHLVRVIRAPGLQRPVTDELAQAVHDLAMEDAETADDVRNTEAWFDLSPRPGSQPAYDLIVVDDRARLWVHEWSALGSGSRWWVISRTGDLLGYVEFPEGVRITSVQCSSAWGIERDELDVSYVVRYRLRGVPGC